MRKVPADVDAITKRESYEFLNKEALLSIYMNDFIYLNGKRKNKIQAWLEHPQARFYRGGVVFRPAAKLPENYLNLWQGFTVKPKTGADTSRIHWHIENIICNGNAELSAYVKDWIAYSFQNPDKPAGAVIVCKGEKGTGKGTIGHFLRKIWGKHGLHISNGDHLVKNFNGHLAETCFLFADEAFYANDVKHESTLKSLVTEPVLMIERKGIDAEQSPNYLKIFMASNKEYTVPATKDERRFCICEVSSEKRNDKTYFDALNKDCDNTDIQAAFLQEMLSRDIDLYSYSNIPETDSLGNERYNQLNSAGKFLVDYLNRDFNSDHINDIAVRDTRRGDDWFCQMQMAVFYELYSYWCNDQSVSTYQRLSERKFFDYIKTLYGTRKTKDCRLIQLGNPIDAIEVFMAKEKVTLLADRRNEWKHSCWNIKQENQKIRLIEEAEKDAALFSGVPMI